MLLLTCLTIPLVLSTAADLVWGKLERFRRPNEHYPDPCDAAATFRSSFVSIVVSTACHLVGAGHGAGAPTAAAIHAVLRLLACSCVVELVFNRPRKYPRDMWFHHGVVLLLYLTAPPLENEPERRLAAMFLSFEASTPPLCAIFIQRALGMQESLFLQLLFAASFLYFRGVGAVQALWMLGSLEGVAFPGIVLSVALCWLELYWSWKICQKLVTKCKQLRTKQE